MNSNKSKGLTSAEKRRQRSANWRSAKNTTRNTERYVRVSELKGGKISCPPDPPPVNTSPWNTAVVQKVITVGTTNKTGDIDCNDIAIWLHDQIGKPFGDYATTIKPIIQLRVKEIRAWNLTGRTIGMQPYDYTSVGSRSTSDLEELGGWIDSGTNTNLPAVGYRWSLALTQHVVTTNMFEGTAVPGSETNNKVCVLLGTSSDNIIFQAHISWRFPPSHTGGVSELRTVYGLTRSIATATKQINGLANQTAKTLSVIRDQMPGKTMGAARVFVVDPIPIVDDDEDCESVGCDIPDAQRRAIVQEHLLSEMTSNNRKIENDLASCSSKYSVIDPVERKKQLEEELATLSLEHGL